jgi:predicted phosphate transport protein (TIGR00153 family)
LEAIENYLSGNLKEASQKAGECDQLETQADKILRGVADKLYSGAFLPIARKDIFMLVEGTDVIANRAESCCDFFMGQQPEIPDLLKEDLLRLARDVVSIYVHFKEAASGLMPDKLSWSLKETLPLRGNIHNVGLLESEIDKSEEALIRKIFASDLPLAHKMQLATFTEKIANIADVMEDAADRLDILFIREQV